MARRERLTAADVRGVWAIMPTPTRPGASDWRCEDIVDLDETARVVDGLIAAGVDGILSMGTLGECATMSTLDKRNFIATAVDAARGRVPFFAGTSSLSTRETIARSREARDLGADGTMLGLPMWCPCDTASAIQFYRDVAEACPELAICIYANPGAFRYDFPRPFWAAVSEIPQVVASKYLGVGSLAVDLAITGGRIKFLPVDADYYAAARLDPDACDAFWTSGAVCGPALAVHFRDVVAGARASGDWAEAKTLSQQITASLMPLIPKGSMEEFARYNIGLEKARMDAAGWMKAGPPSPPYHILPEEYRAGAEKSGRMWAELESRLGLVPAPRGPLLDNALTA